MISAFDLFSLGVGPSSSHTVGPMRAARAFVLDLSKAGLLDGVRRVRAELFGSLGATGRGHGSDRAVVAGLEGAEPETVDPAWLLARLDQLTLDPHVDLLGVRRARLDPQDLVLHKRETLAGHPNAMRLTAYGDARTVLHEEVFYSVGGGFIVRESEHRPSGGHPEEEYGGFASAAELLEECAQGNTSISAAMRRRERMTRTDEQIDQGLLHIWAAMNECIQTGIATSGVLPGGLRVPRRAATVHAALLTRPQDDDPLHAMDWVNLFALAVNEENAGGGRVVTAPTNGAAGIIPAVLAYYVRFVPGADQGGIIRFLLASAAIGGIIKRNASISGAEVGCQGEVGSACAMAAAGLCEALGGTPQQVENAAEIGMEHNLGLTCDPIGGLVQIPCIERNAIAAVKAINAARMALHGNGAHIVSLDAVIRTMRDTGRDMSTRYKETALGGLAVNVVEC